MTMLGVFREVRIARWVRKARRGDRDAFRALYDELYPILSGFVGRRVAVREDAEDVVARVFERLLVALGEIDEAKGGARAWVLGVARNAVIDLGRTRRVSIPIDAVPERLLAEDAGALDGIVRNDDVRAARALLAEYPDEVREMFAMRFGDGLLNAEIAALLGTTEAAVKQRFSRTLRELKDALAGKQAGGEAFDYGT